jgi:hypothetical protein
MKVTVKVLLLAAVVVLGYMCYSSLMTNITFENQEETRKDAIVARLLDIRKAQIEYKNVHGVHAANFDELTHFLNEEKLPFISKIGELTDKQLQEGMTEQEAVKKGIIRRDTMWVLAKDTLFNKDFDASQLRYVPGIKTQAGEPLLFFMDTATLTSGSGYTVKVFEASVKYDDYLWDLDKQLLFNKDEVF